MSSGLKNVSIQIDEKRHQSIKFPTESGSLIIQQRIQFFMEIRILLFSTSFENFLDEENIYIYQPLFRFYQIQRFPGCIGKIDVTHIPIINPGGENVVLYQNRKRFFSLKCQLIEGFKRNFICLCSMAWKCSRFTFFCKLSYLNKF